MLINKLKNIPEIINTCFILKYKLRNLNLKLIICNLFKYIYYYINKNIFGIFNIKMYRTLV